MRPLFFLFLLMLAAGCAPKQHADQQTNLQAVDTIVPKDTPISRDTHLPERWKQKAIEGIDFIATGNEPFWSIELDEEKFIRFSTPDGTELITASVKPILSDNITRLYKAETEKGRLELQIINKFCVNDMSGDSSAYTVFLKIKLKADKETKDYHGCGTSLKQ